MKVRSRLRHSRWQAAFAVAAMATAVALPVVLLSVGGGVSSHELAQLEDSGFQVTVSAGGIHGIQAAHHLAQKIDQIPNVAAASPVLSVAADVFVGARGATPALVEGVVPDAFQATEGRSASPLFPHPLPLGDPTDELHFANGTYAGPATWDVLVSTPFALQYGSGLGTKLSIATAPNRSAATTFTVSGFFGVPQSLLSPTAAFALIVPLSDLQVVAGVARSNGSATAPSDAADTVEVGLAGAASTDPAAVRSVAQQINQIVPYYGVSSLLDEVTSLREGAAVLQGFYLALSSVSLVVGLIFLALVLLRRVEGQRRSIGVRRALGVPASLIARDVVADGVGLAGAGAIGGVVGGWAIVTTLATWGSPLVQRAASLAVFDPATLAGLVLGVLGLSLLAGAVATRSALRASIPEALR